MAPSIDNGRATFGRGGEMSPAPRSPGVRSQKTAIRLARRIVDEIIRNGFEPNSRLPQEKEMLDYYRVGRATLREALRHLEFLGILEIRSGPGGGPVLLAPDGNDLGSVLGLLLALSRTKFGEVVEILEVLEPVVAASAAAHASDEVISGLRKSVGAMADESLTYEQFLDENRKFHDLIAEGSGNRVLEYFNDSLHTIIDGAVVGGYYSRRRRKLVIESHDRITQAIERRDPEAARAAMANHIEGWKRYVSTRHPESLVRPLSWTSGD